MTADAPRRRLSERVRRGSWFLAGPTASGKSGVAMALVRSLATPAEVIALDSMTLYRGMDVGTAKPSVEDTAEVPHHLVDVLDPHETFSVAEYVAAASDVAEAVLGRGGVPVFVGGSGLYLRSLLRGLFEGPPADEAVRRAIAARGDAATLHAELAGVDPAAAAAIEPNDLRRTVRALEVHELTGRTISSFRDEATPDEAARRVFWLDRDRADLHRRINARTDGMIEAGWAEEAARLARLEPPLSRTARQGLGYGELIDAAEGRVPLPDAVERIKARTRQFAKRQCTWFRNLPECVRVPVPEGETPEETAVRLRELAAAAGA